MNGPLTRLLRYLTSDAWHLDFRPGDHAWAFNETLDISSERVALFSGGLDSICFAARPGPQTTLVSHYPRGGLGRIQRRLSSELGYKDWQHAQFDTQILGARNEQSSRSRGLLFIALGLVVCSGNNASELVVPENGLMSVSCGKPYAYNTAPYGNCGYCYPCLVRHASLNAAGADHTAYRKSPDDVRGGHGSPTTQADLTALRTWLARSDPTESDLIAASRWPPGTDLPTHLTATSRGRDELRATWLR